MSYEILSTAQGVSILPITTADFPSFTGWRVEFDDGKEAMLYQRSGEWMQYDELLWLDVTKLKAIGNCIDDSQAERNPGMAERYFYSMMIN